MMCGGDANVKRGWYGASKGEVNGVLVSGFDYPRNHGVYLSAKDHPVESLQSSPSDEDGVMHMLICRVILGRLEVVNPFDKIILSSDSFHSGVDDLMYPKKYIIWAANMNTHILPFFWSAFVLTHMSPLRIYRGFEYFGALPNLDACSCYDK